MAGAGSPQAVLLRRLRHGAAGHGHRRRAARLRHGQPEQGGDRGEREEGGVVSAPRRQPPPRAMLAMAPIWCAVPTTHWAAAKWPLPLVRSATTIGNNTPINLAPMPSSSCTPIGQAGSPHRV